MRTKISKNILEENTTRKSVIKFYNLKIKLW